MLRFENVSYAYRDRPALNDFTLSASPGVTGLLGVNGAGKTTALRIAVGELRPQTGRFSASTVPDTSRELVGYCPQSVSLPKDLRVGEFLRYLSWLRKVTRSRRDQVVAEALEWADLIGQRHSQIGSLSGGMQRRLLIAQALMDRPPVLLLDEPTTGLDPEQRARIRELLGTLPPETVVLLSSHIVEDISVLAIRTAVVHEGQVLRLWTRAEVQESGSSLEALFLTAITSSP